MTSNPKWQEADPAETWYGTMDPGKECVCPIRAWRADVADGQIMVVFQWEVSNPDFEFDYWAGVRYPLGSWQFGGALNSREAHQNPPRSVEEAQERAQETMERLMEAYVKAFGDTPANTIHWTPEEFEARMEARRTR